MQNPELQNPQLQNVLDIIKTITNKMISHTIILHGVLKVQKEI